MIIREGLFNGKREVKSKVEVPDHKREEELAKEYNDVIKKNFSKITSVVKKVSTKPEYKDAAKGLKMESFSPCAKSSRIFSNKENGYIYAFSYDIASVDISKVYKNPRAQMNEDGAKEYSDFVKEIISDASSYVKVIAHNAYVEDGGDWDMALISIIIPYTGGFVTESFTVLDDEDDDVVVADNESATEIPDEREAFIRYFNVEDVEPSLTDDPEEEYYRDPIFNKAITEHFNMLDTKTRRTLLHLNEAQQNSVVMSLTSKLYDKIVEKCEDIDYGEIPATKGDITKLSKYESMKETIAIMHDLLKEYNQDTGPVDELSVALSNVESRREIFERAYRYNSELPMVMYCNIVLGIITGISYMIATCIEFIKDPGSENFRISLDKIAYAKSKDHMIYNTLKSFNKTCVNKEFDKAMEAVLKTSTKNFGGAVAAGSIAMVVLGTILVLIPVLRELIFMFYYMRMRISDFYDMQADLLQANAYSIEANSTLDKSEQKKIMAKQLNYVAKFRKISNAFAIDIKKAEVESDKSKKADDETKMLIDDIDGIDTGSNGSSLF